MEKLELNVIGETKIIEIREGAALPLQEPTALEINGNYDAVSRFVKNRSENIKSLPCHILINREKKTIRLVVDENNYYAGMVTGKLELTELFRSFEINTGKSRTTFELADFIKMNRSCFQSPSVAANLVTLLNNFKAKVDRDLENSDDRRGNKALAIRQIVESNVPDSFKVALPIFKGQKAVNIDIEVNIDTDNFNCTLISPQAAEIVKLSVDHIFDDEIEKIKETNLDILIIEQ